MPVLSIINDDFFLQRMDFFYFGECVSGEHILVLADYSDIIFDIAKVHAIVTVTTPACRP